MSSQQRNLFDLPPDIDPWSQDEQADEQIATVVFAEAPYGPFDYLVPANLRDKVEPGRRVRVPLGMGDRTVVGYCVETRVGSSQRRRLKAVRTVVDLRPLVSRPMLEVTRWMADYYLCPLGQVLEGVIPAGVRGQAGTREVTLLCVPPEVAERLDQIEDLPPKQFAALRLLAKSPRPLTPAQLAKIADCGPGPINALREKKLVREETSRLMFHELEEVAATRETNLVLNDDQRRALDVILAPINAGQPQTILIHGVTGSGKTEVYIQAIEQVVRLERQAIVLVPEISLTPQTCQRFRSRFEQIAVLHSHLSDSERHAHWRRIAAGEVQVVVGARSAIFAPTPRLGLIILDEEHDSSFKQDSSPRYNARDVARQRSLHERCPLVLGSATPSLDSWRRSQTGEITLVSMPSRVANLPLPDVAVIDLRTEMMNRESRGAISRPLHQAMDQALKGGGQVILLLNRRGFSTSIQCPKCGYVAKCPDCDLPLTHHKEAEKAICHYCDFTIRTPPRCPQCDFDGIRFSGLGTQKLEAEVQARFRNVPLLRMDSDTMQQPGSHEAALARFRAGEVKILVGTQMIAKGLDFPNVTLVGVVNADTALHFPDFRAAERTFQLVTQVAGRTGRGPKGGRVCVQTSSPDHPAIQAAARHDFLMFAAGELPTREQFGYPPFSQMIRLIIRGPEEAITEAFAEQTADRLRAAYTPGVPDTRVLGPAPCPIAKLRSLSRFHILIHSPHGELLRPATAQVLAAQKPPTGIQWAVDVDPLDML